MKLTLFAIALVGLLSAAEKRDPVPTDKQIKDFAAEVERIAPTPAWALPAPKLPPSAHQATEISAAWLGGNSQPSAGRDGRVLFTFGAAVPVIICAPLRVCVVELQAGEHIISEPHVGDTKRWDVSPALVGKEPTQTVLVIIKPTVENLDTNMVLTTDRHAYYLRLVSSADGKWMARTAFDYPDDSAATWQAAIKAQASAAVADEKQPVVIERHGPENFKYEIRAKSKAAEAFKPVRVWDQDGKVRLVMPPGMQHRDAPVLMIVGSSGKDEQVNWRTDGDTYVVDRLFDRAVLVLGVGKHAARVEIVRKAGA